MGVVKRGQLCKVFVYTEELTIFIVSLFQRCKSDILGNKQKIE